MTRTPPRTRAGLAGVRIPYRRLHNRDEAESGRDLRLVSRLRSCDGPRAGGFGGRPALPGG